MSGHSLQELKTLSMIVVEHWMRATVLRVQWSQFASVRHSALALGIPEEKAAAGSFPMSTREDALVKWHTRFVHEVAQQEITGRIGEDVGGDKEVYEWREQQSECALLLVLLSAGVLSCVVAPSADEPTAAELEAIDMQDLATNEQEEELKEAAAEGRFFEEQRERLASSWTFSDVARAA